MKKRQVIRRALVILLSVSMILTSFGSYGFTSYAQEPDPIVENTQPEQTPAENAGEGTSEPSNAGTPSEAETYGEGTTPVESNVPEGSDIPGNPTEGIVPGEGDIPADENTPEDPGAAQEDVLVPESGTRQETAEDIPELPADFVIEIPLDSPAENIPADTLPDSEILFERYFNRVMYGQNRHTPLMAPRSSRLKPVEQRAYVRLKELITKVAQGRRESAEFEIPVTDLCDKTFYTWAELGVTEPLTYNPQTNTYVLSEAAQTAVNTYFSVDLSNVLRALMLDAPYELYWMDKEMGWYGGSMGAVNATATGVQIYSSHVFCLGACVVSGYSKEKVRGTYLADTVKCGATLVSAQNARVIVEEAAAICQNDYEVLKYYYDKICDLTDYNWDALREGVDYGDVWQLLWVFDNDPDTKVVCEGYAKAFKYLCDLTDFYDDTIEAYLVTGDGSLSPDAYAPHMWNVVRMNDGAYYLVDVTNGDQQQRIYTLFLNGYVRTQSNAQGKTAFAYRFFNTFIYYIFDEDTVDWFDVELLLSSANYDPNNAVIVSEAYLQLYDPATGVFYNREGNPCNPDDKIAIRNGNIYGTLPSPVRAGYAFEGWYTKETGGVRVLPATVFRQPAGTTQVLYAYWKANTYRLNLDAAGGSFTGSAIRAATYDQPYGELPVPSKAGYTFTGWYLGEQRITANTIVKIEENATLTAHWTPLVVRVNLDANGGQTSTKTFDVSYEQTYGAAFLPGDLPVPVRDGYTFTGWYTAADGGRPVLSETVMTSLSEHTLYAHWEINRYTVILDAGGGTFGDGSTRQERQIVYGTVYGTLPVPAKDGAVLSGWYAQPAIPGSPEVPVTASDRHQIAGDIVLKAHWDHAVSFKLNGGSFPDATAATAHVTEGQHATRPTDPVRTRYTFTGWYSDPELNNHYSFDTPVRGALTLYAGWNPVHITKAPLIQTVSGQGAQSGRVVKGAHVRLSCDTPDAVIYYRLYPSKTAAEQDTDAFADLTACIRYTQEIVITGNLTIAAVAVKEDYKESLTVYETFIVEEPSWGDISAEDRLQAGFISPEEVPDRLWVAGVEDRVYQGSEVTFDLRVYDHKTLLVAGRDYTVSYKNNINAADTSVASKAPAVIITGKGNYSGQITVYFTIKKRHLGTVTVQDTVLAYNGRVQKGTTVVSFVADGKTITLRAGTDFTYQYTDAGDYREKGAYTVTLDGKGNYEGTIAYIQTITDRTLLSKVTVSTIPNQAYTGGAVTPALTLKYGGATLRGIGETEYVEGMTDIDYTYRFENNTSVGTARVVLTGYGAYAGTRVVTFNITGYALSGAKWTGLKTNTVYTGNAITQDEAVLTYTTGRGASAVTETLTEGIDYTVSYTNNTAAGMATATYTGMGKYTGSVNKTWRITQYNIQTDPDDLITVVYDDDVPYAKNGAKPVPEVYFDGRLLTPGTDYTLSYADNNKIAAKNTTRAPAMIITGKGCFEGTLRFTFGIRGRNISALSADAQDVVYTGRTGQYNSAIVIADQNGAVLRSGTDYESALVYTYAEDTELDNLTVRYRGQAVQAGDVVPAGTLLKVTATGRGCYTGEIAAEYRVVSADLSRASVSVHTQYYTGREIRPDKSQIVVTLSGRVLGEEDYEIVSYQNNINRGTAKLTIRGVGAYGKEKTVNFTIADRSLYYNISFNGNGATSGGPARMQMTAGNIYTLNANNFRRPNYVFNGWNTRADGSGTAYGDKEQIAPTDRDAGAALVLYAQWIPVTYTITYHQNGGPNHPLNTKHTYTAADAAFAIHAPEPDTWPAGYQFAGWYTDEGFKNKITIVRAGTSGNLELYAKWVPYTYRVTFDGNGAEKGTMNDQILSYGAVQTLNKNAYTRAGYAFMGWSQDPYATKAQFENAQRVSNLLVPVSNDRESITLYAVWRDTFSITYETNGGRIDRTDAAYIDNYRYGTKAALPVPARTGYAFAGWYSDDNTFRQKVSSVAAATSGDLMLYAKWTPNTYTIVFDGNGKTSGAVANLSVTYDTGTALRMNAYQRKGYAFRGWSLTKDGEVRYADGAQVRWEDFSSLSARGTLMLYAVWEETPYQITYVTNGGTVTASAPSSYRYNHGNVELPEPLRTGFTFGGWYKDADFRTKIAVITSAESSDLTLYARWTAPVTVYFEKGAGEVTGTMAAQTIRYENSTALCANEYRRTGYVFMGWALSAADAANGIVAYTNGQRVQTPPDTHLTLSGGALSMTLYAVWRNEFTVSFEGQNGETYPTVTYRYGTGLAANALPVPVRDGYTFAGWYREQTYRTRVNSLAASTYGDMTLYAKWAGQEYTVTFIGNAPEGKTTAGKMNVQTLTYGTAAALNKCAFSVKGYTFRGWSLTLGGDVIYMDRAPVTGGSRYENLTLYAVWSKDTYSLSYANLSPAMINRNPVSYTVDDAFALSDPEILGNTFLGWYADAACRSRVTEIKPGTTGNKTLYAKWRTDTYTISYVLNGGRIADTATGYMRTYLKDGITYYILPDAVRDGYRFDGWYKESALRTRVTEVSADSNISLTLYAKWTLYTPQVRTAEALGLAQTYLSLNPFTGADRPWDKVICFGDSLTVGVQAGRDRRWGTDTVAYPNVMASYLGGARVINAGVGGAAVNSADANPLNRIIVQSAAAHGDADAVFFMGGTVDWIAYSDPVGNPYHTFSANFSTICDNIRSLYPNADVFVILPPDGNVTVATPLSYYREAEWAVAQAKGFYVIDPAGQGIMDASDVAVRKTYYSDDVHPNNAGYQVLGMFITAQALQMVR